MDIQVLTKVVELCEAHNITEFTSPEFSFKIGAARVTSQLGSPVGSTPEMAAEIIRAQLENSKSSIVAVKKMREQEERELEMWSLPDELDE